MADDDQIARNTRRRPFVDGRSRRRGFGGEAGPEDRIGADAIGEGRDDDEEEDDEDDEPRPRKAAAKKPAKVAAKEAKPAKASKAAKAPKGDDDDEDDEDFDDDEEVDDEESRRPTARVRKQVSVYEEPDSDSDELFVVRPTDILYPMARQGRWTEVENEEGDYGWIETAYLDLDGAGPRKRVIDVGARLGLMIIQQGMRSPGSPNTKVPDNYNIGTSSVTLSLGAGMTMPLSTAYLVGGEIAYDYAKTLFGGIYYDPDGAAGPMPGVTTGIALHNVNVRAMAGYDFKKKSGMAVFGRLGYRYQSYLVPEYDDPAKNPAKIPQEVVKAPTIGAAFALPRLTDSIGARLALDAILFGSSITQTKGLEDGETPSAKAVVVGATVNYRWKKAFDLQATYDLRYMGIAFGAPPATSTRGHMGTNITRTDFFHMVTFGIAKPF